MSAKYQFAKASVRFATRIPQTDFNSFEVELVPSPSRNRFRDGSLVSQLLTTRLSKLHVLSISSYGKSDSMRRDRRLEDNFRE